MKKKKYTVANLLKIHFWGILTDVAMYLLKFSGQ